MNTNTIISQTKIRIAILGSGESGVGSAILAKAKGYDVFVSDKNIISEKYKTELVKYKIDFEEGMHTEALILNANEIIKSPGIPYKADLVLKAIEKNIPVISEIEFCIESVSLTLKLDDSAK